ncbi:MAG: tetratricopeptide repeat protein [Sedimentisphaerales bacterium]
MAFDPLSWAIGYALKKGLDRLLTHKSLASNLQKTFSQWAKNLPPDAHIYPDSDFAAIDQNPDPAKQPSLCALRKTILDNHIPTESQWLDALLEQWRLVPGTVEEPQKFFKLEEDIARQHLTRLAKALADECKKYDTLFKVSTIDELRKISSKLDGLVTQSKPVPQGSVHNLPYTSIRDLLKGRDDALKSLDKRLSSPDHKAAAITQPQAVHGLGGVGKTRLAVEYAWFALQNKKYNTVLFVIADSSASIDTNIATLASPDLLNLPEFNQPNQSVMVKAVLSCLASRNDWLLIIDNVDTPEVRKYLNQILPHLSSGRIIITSRSSNWPANIADLSIDKLSTPDAASYLLETTQNKRTPSNDDNHFAAQLADKLDGLPIALEQAAAYISHRHISIQTYLNEFESSKKEVLSWHNPLLVNYPLPVLTVWQSSEKQLSAPARAILQLSSLLSPEPIPVALFESASEKIFEVAKLLCRAGFAPPKTKLDIRSLLAELSDYSLIKLTESSFIIHRLVQGSIRLSISDLDIKFLTKIVLEIIEDYMPRGISPQDIRSWPVYKSIEPHFTFILPSAELLEIFEPTGHILNHFGLYFVEQARYTEAEMFYCHTLKIYKNSFGPDNPKIATVLNNLAELLRETGRYKEAEPFYRLALQIDEGAFGKDHSNIARDINNLALLLHETNRLTEAEPFYRRALEIYEKSLSKDHPKVTNALNNLAQLLKDTNRQKESEPLMHRVIESWEKSFGHDHPKVASALNNLAVLLHDTNRPEEAEPLMRRALEIYEKSYGPDHPDVARTLNNLAVMLEAMNRLAEAETLMKRGLEIEEKSKGKNNPHVAIQLNNLAGLYKSTNRLSDAEQLMKRAMAIDEASFGKDHPNVATDLNNLAILYQSINRKDEAIKLLERAVKILEDSYGPDHPKTITARQNLASLG